MNNNEPLWKVIRDVRRDEPLRPGSDGTLETVIAAEIRAVADWLVPSNPGAGPLSYVPGIGIDQRQSIRAALYAQANLAEQSND